MNTVAINNNEKTKKLVELPKDVCHRLALQAAVMGTSVKRLMENMIISAAEDAEDGALYAYLQRTRPDGNVMLSAEEQKEVLERLEKKATIK
jgi:hypothetical protein